MLSMQKFTINYQQEHLFEGEFVFASAKMSIRIRPKGENYHELLTMD